MKIKAAIFDIDGTLVPYGRPAPSGETIRALEELSKSGTAVIIATGRGRFAGQAALGGLTPDYYVASNGADVTDAAGHTVWSRPMTQEEMYVLVDFCEDYDLPLQFTFSDGYYVYCEYEKLLSALRHHPEMIPFFHDGEDQVRHLESMPLGSCVSMNEQQEREFSEKYGYLGMNLIRFAPDRYDAIPQGSGKKTGAEHLLQKLGISWEEAAAFGDAENDLELHTAAGLSVAMENAEEILKEQADIIAPPADMDGVAKVVRQYLDGTLKIPMREEKNNVL